MAFVQLAKKMRPTGAGCVIPCATTMTSCLEVNSPNSSSTHNALVSSGAQHRASSSVFINTQAKHQQRSTNKVFAGGSYLRSALGLPIGRTTSMEMSETPSSSSSSSAASAVLRKQHQRNEMLCSRVVCAANRVMMNPNMSTTDALHLVQQHQLFKQPRRAKSGTAEANPDEPPHHNAEAPLWPGWGMECDDNQTCVKVLDILKRKVDAERWLTCSSHDTVLSAVQKMASANLGSLLVMEPPVENDVTGPPPDNPQEVLAKSDLVGIVTERDYLLKVAVEGRTSANTKVHEIMTRKSQIMVLCPCDSVTHAMHMMADKNIRHLPVVQNDHLLGVVSIRDVVSAIVRSQREDIDYMRDFIQGGPTYSGPHDPVA